MTPCFLRTALDAMAGLSAFVSMSALGSLGIVAVLTLAGSHRFPARVTAAAGTVLVLGSLAAYVLITAAGDLK